MSLTEKLISVCICLTLFLSDNFTISKKLRTNQTSQMENLNKIEDRPSWNSMKTPRVMERMLDLYKTSKWHDCVFKLWNSDGTGEELVFAHNLILASSSPVFEALCFGPLAEGSTIEIPDIDPLAFKMMLKFIYTDCIEFTSVEMACNVLYASKKYLIYSLADLCTSYILYHVNETNCLQVYSFATFIQEDQLVRETWKYLCSHLDHVSNYFSYESLSSDLIKNLVNEEALNVDELILFKACVMWAESECDNNNLEKNGENLRKILIQADVLNKIRLLTLSLKEFEEGPKKSGILTNEEINFITNSLKLIHRICLDCENENDMKHKSTCRGTILDNITGSDFGLLKSMISESKVCPFSISSNFKPRKKIQLKKFYCHRFIEKEMRPSLAVQNNLKINTYIIANKSVRLTAVFLNAKTLTGLLTTYSYPHAIERYYNEKLVISICDNNDKILFSTTFYQKVSYGSEFKITLPNPVILERSKEYNVQIDLLNSPENYLFCVRNSILKFPSGLCVTFREQADIVENGASVETKFLSIISGIELCL